MDLDVHSNQPFRFLDLSAETRLQVYEHLVVVGKVFYSPDDFTLQNEDRFRDWTLYRKPELQLLRVCKQIHDEAEKVYLSKNLFVLPDFFHFRNPINLDILQPPGHIPFPEMPLVSNAASKLLKNISISFNVRQPTPNMMTHSKLEHLGPVWPGQPFKDMAPEKRVGLAHCRASQFLGDAWNQAARCLTDFLAPPNEDGFEDNGSDEDKDNDRPKVRNLLNLEIDLTKTYCPIGCCRLGVHVALLFAKLRPRNVTVIGLRTEQEQNAFLERVNRDYRYGMGRIYMNRDLVDLLGGYQKKK
jgi:hypothetical protein